MMSTDKMSTDKISTDIMSNRQNAEQTKCRTDKMQVNQCMQNIEESIAIYVVDVNLFRLGSTNPKKKIQTLDFFWWGSMPRLQKGNLLFFSKVLKCT